MKTILTIIGSLVFFAGTVCAQKIKAVESSEKIGSGKNNALVVSIYEASMDVIEKEWRSEMKGLRGKVSTAGSDIFTDNAFLKSMGNNSVDIYARFEKVSDKETKLIVGVDLGGAYMTSSQHGQAFGEMRDLVNAFALRVSKEAVMAQLKEAEKALEKIQKKQAGLIKTNEELKRDIESYKAKIQQAEREVDSNVKEQDATKKELEAQTKVVEAIREKERKIE
jgi:DNA invertase Pin-like site-specific DNA recombinase